MTSHTVFFIQPLGNKLRENDIFLEKLGLFQEKIKAINSKVDYILPRYREGALCHSESLCLPIVECKNKNYCSINYHLIGYKCITISVTHFVLYFSFKKKVFERWYDENLTGWFCILHSFNNYYRVCFGDLSYMRRYLLQNQNIGPENMPKAVGFRTEEDWMKINWVKLVDS